MGDITVIMLAVGMIFLCWIMIKVNDKVDRYIKRFKRLENALVKNSTNRMKTVEETPKPKTPEIPTAKTSRDLKVKGINFIAKK